MSSYLPPHIAASMVAKSPNQTGAITVPKPVVHPPPRPPVNAGSAKELAATIHKLGLKAPTPKPVPTSTHIAPMPKNTAIKKPVALLGRSILVAAKPKPKPVLGGFGKAAPQAAPPDIMTSTDAGGASAGVSDMSGWGDAWSIATSAMAGDDSAKASIAATVDLARAGDVGAINDARLLSHAQRVGILQQFVQYYLSQGV